MAKDLTAWWRDRRLQRVARTSKHLLGQNAGGADEEAQQYNVGVFVRACFDGGYDPEVLCRSLMVGAIWIADNINIPRAKLIEMVGLVEMKKERQLIYTPDDK